MGNIGCGVQAAYQLLGDYESARATYDKALDMDPSNTELAQGLNQLSLGEGGSQGKEKGDQAFKTGRYDVRICVIQCLKSV